MSKTRSAHMRTAFFALSLAVSSVASCSLFDLGDVVDESTDASSSNEATIGAEGSPSDAATADDFGPCIEGGNPCSCPPEAIVKTATGTGTALFVSGSTIYFMTRTNTYVFAVYASPVDANPTDTPRLVASSGSSVIAEMALGANTLFFRHTSGSLGIVTADVDAAGLPLDVYFSPLPESPGPMAVTSTRLLFSGTSSEVCSIPLIGEPMPTAAECGGDLAVLPRDAGSPVNGPAITASETDAFYPQANHIYRGSLADGGTSLVVNASSNVQNLTQSGGRLFWMNDGDGGTISSVANAGGPLTPLVSSSGIVSASSALAVDDAGIYWTENGSASNADVWTAARDGTGSHRVICDFTENALVLATDASFVYVLSQAGNVYRVPKQ
jgi:hypothetical protein